MFVSYPENAKSGLDTSPQSLTQIGSLPQSFNLQSWPSVDSPKDGGAATKTQLLWKEFPSLCSDEALNLVNNNNNNQPTLILCSSNNNLNNNNHVKREASKNSLSTNNLFKQSSLEDSLESLQSEYIISSEKTKGHNSSCKKMMLSSQVANPLLKKAKSFKSIAKKTTEPKRRVNSRNTIKNIVNQMISFLSSPECYPILENLSKDQKPDLFNLFQAIIKHVKKYRRKIKTIEELTNMWKNVPTSIENFSSYVRILSKYFLERESVVRIITSKYVKDKQYHLEIRRYLLQTLKKLDRDEIQ